MISSYSIPASTPSRLPSSSPGWKRLWDSIPSPNPTTLRTPSRWVTSSSSMSMAPNRLTSLRDRLGSTPGRFLWSATTSVPLDDLQRGSSLGDDLVELSGRSIVIVTRDQLAAARALIDLDGVAHRLTVCTPDLPPRELPSIIDRAAA